MAGPPPPPPPMGHESPPPQMRGVKFKKMTIKDFRKSKESDQDLPESLTQSKQHESPVPVAPPPKRLPPPPPPPPALGEKPKAKVNLDHLPKPKLFVRTKKTLRLHWTPVDPIKIAKESFWTKQANISDGIIRNSLEKCCVHFEKPADVKVRGGGTAKTGVEQIIGKGGMGMEGAAERHIIKSGLAPEEIRQGVLNFDTENTQLLQIIRSLKGTLNDPTKVMQLNAAKDNYENMTILDKVAILLAGIPHISTYVQWLLRHEDFDVDCKRLSGNSDIPIAAIDKLTTNRGWLHTLQLILVIGNSMNAGISPTGAYGFDLKSINKLRDTKSVCGYTFMEYLVELIEDEFPNYSQFWKDFDCLNTGTKVSEKRTTIVEETENLNKLMELLCSLLEIDRPSEGSVLKNLEKIESMVHAKPKSFFDNHRFVPKILPLAMRLSAVIKQVKSDLLKGDEGFARAKIFFCIDSKADGGGEYNIDMFMADMKLFMGSLEDAYAKIQTKKLERERRARKMSMAGKERYEKTERPSTTRDSRKLPEIPEEGLPKLRKRPDSDLHRRHSPRLQPTEDEDDARGVAKLRRMFERKAA